MKIADFIHDRDIDRIENDPALVFIRDSRRADGRLLAYIELLQARAGMDVAGSRRPMLFSGVLPSLGEIVDHLFSRGIYRYSTYLPDLELVRVINSGRRVAA